MSVYKSRRRDAAAQFITGVRELRIQTMRIAKKFPKGFRYLITDSILKLANDAYTSSVRANSVYMHQNMLQSEFELREYYLTGAISAVDALSSEISFCYSMLADGNNFFDNRAEYDGKFARWEEAAIVALNRLHALKESDKKRYRQYRKGN